MIDTEWHRADGDERSDPPTMLDEGLHPTSEVLLGDIEQEEGRLAMIESLPVEDVLGASRSMEEGERGVTELDAAPCVSIMVRSDRRGSKEDDLAVHGIQAPTEAFVGFLLNWRMVTFGTS